MKMMVIARHQTINDVLVFLQGELSLKVLEIIPVPPHGHVMIVFEAEIEESESAIDILCMIEEELGDTLVTY